MYRRSMHTQRGSLTLQKTYINKLQTTQNTALWIATGCTKSTPLPHLHEETQVLTLTSHMDMRGTHIHSRSTAPPTLHAKPNTNTEKHTSDTSTTLYQMLHNTLPSIPDGSAVKTHIHTEFTQRALDSSLLGVRLPAACRTEFTLDCWQRVQLGWLHTSPLIHVQARTCSGWLLSQLLWTGPSWYTGPCPQTQQHRITHDIHSLEHLWTRPVEVSNFFLYSIMVQRPTQTHTRPWMSGPENPGRSTRRPKSPPLRRDPGPRNNNNSCTSTGFKYLFLSKEKNPQDQSPYAAKG